MRSEYEHLLSRVSKENEEITRNLKSELHDATSKMENMENEKKDQEESFKKVKSEFQETLTKDSYSSDLL